MPSAFAILDFVIPSAGNTVSRKNAPGCVGQRRAFRRAENSVNSASVNDIFQRRRATHSPAEIQTRNTLIRSRARHSGSTYAPSARENRIPSRHMRRAWDNSAQALAPAAHSGGRYRVSTTQCRSRYLLCVLCSSLSEERFRMRERETRTQKRNDPASATWTPMITVCSYSRRSPTM
jgi:hypothetical protein